MNKSIQNASPWRGTLISTLSKWIDFDRAASPTHLPRRAEHWACIVLAGFLASLSWGSQAESYSYCGLGNWIDHHSLPGKGYCDQYGEDLTGKLLEEANSKTTCGGYYKTYGYYNTSNQILAIKISNGNCEADREIFRINPPESISAHCAKYGGTGNYRWMYYHEIQPFGGYGTLGVTCEVKIAPSVLQFSSTSYHVNENGGEATITVSRVGGSDGAASIDYTTTDGTATAGSDYTQTTGTLNWADGDAADKTFTINIIDDSEQENDETLIVSLGNSTGGARLGTPYTAVLTITDNDNHPIGGSAAIIIAGGGSDDSNTLWDTTAATSNYIYKMLYKRGFKHDEIYYLSPQSYADFDGDGLDDGIVDIPTTPRALNVEDVRNALTWAKTRGQLNQPLYVFFTNHGGSDRFLIAKNSYLEVQDFKAMLDDYQNETGNQLALVIDACYSGILLNKLIAPNRAIISSTGDGLAYFDRISKQGFNRFFAEGLLKGMNFYEAFNDASKKQTKLVKSFSIGDDQNPQWYDGTTDGQWLRDIFINGGLTVGDFTLTVSAITPSNQDLPADSTLPLMAEISLAEGSVEKVWAVLKPPKVNLVMDSYGTPILSFPRLNLSRTQKENVWASTWGDAVYNGEYEIIFYAEDNQGNIAGSEPITINVKGGVESPETSSVQIALEKDSYSPGEHFQARLTEELAWGYDLYAAVVMPDGNFFALTKENEFAAINSVAKWDKQRIPHSPVMLLDLTLPENLPRGEYCLYGILSPENESVLETLELWVWTLRCFELKDALG
jgi:hypothetical protein